LFGEVGEVVDVHIPKDRETGRPRGFAFVRFASEDQAKQAIEELHGREVGGRALRLDLAEDRPRPPRPRREFKPSSDRYGADRPRHAEDLGGADFGPQDYGRDDYGRGDYGREDYRNDDEYDGRGGKRLNKPKRPKGSRRGLRAKKRSL
jgi:RNA recognition motif-containing protein